MNEIWKWTVSVLATIGIGTVVYGIAWLVYRVWDTFKKLNETLTEVVGFLREHRADLHAVQQLSEVLNRPEPEIRPMPTFNGGATMQSAMIYGPPMPPYQTRREEPDAEKEEVDVTASEHELVEADQTEHLAKMGLGRPDPTFHPKAIEVDSE